MMRPARGRTSLCRHSNHGLKLSNAAHATYYAEIVREKATFRSLIFAATEILRDAYDESQEAPHLLIVAAADNVVDVVQRPRAKADAVLLKRWVGVGERHGWSIGNHLAALAMQSRAERPRSTG